MMVAVPHDWDDERSIAILKSIRKAMAEDAIVLIMENVLPEKAEMCRAVDSYLLDLEMRAHSRRARVDRPDASIRRVRYPPFAGIGRE
jgi:hypothetical protein